MYGSCGFGSFGGWAAQEVDGGEFAQKGEVSAATGAGKWLRFREFWNRIKLCPEVEADGTVCPDGRSTGKAVVAHPRKTFG